MFFRPYVSFVSISFLAYLFFFNPTATTEIYTLSLHDALPIFETVFDGLEDLRVGLERHFRAAAPGRPGHFERTDRKSTRLNSSHRCISYAVFCLKKKTKTSQAERHIPPRSTPRQARRRTKTLS